MAWITLGESVTGTSHFTRNAPCQDAFRYSIFSSDKWLVIAVSDGAGSASCAEIGAALACDELIRRVQAIKIDSLFDRIGIDILFTEVRKTLVAKAESLNVPQRELACTVLLAVVGPDSASMAQLGDGAIVFRQAHDYRVAFWPEPAEYANETNFLTDDHAIASIQFDTFNETINEVAALTDGLQRLALDFGDRTAYAGFFEPLFDELRRSEDPKSLSKPFRLFLDSERVNNRTDDDKTLVLAIRQP